MERYTGKHYGENGYYLICSGNCETLNCGDCGILDKIVDRLAAYEDTGLEPEEIEIQSIALAQCKPYMDTLCDEQGKVIVNPVRLRELAQADKEGRIRILSAGKGKTCGTCANFQPVPGHKCGDCKARKYFRASQSRRACSMYIGKDGSYAD